MFLKIKQIKQHLNIDADYTMDDDYLIQLAEVSELIVQKKYAGNSSKGILSILQALNISVCVNSKILFSLWLNDTLPIPSSSANFS